VDLATEWLSRLGALCAGVDACDALGKIDGLPAGAGEVDFVELALRRSATRCRSSRASSRSAAGAAARRGAPPARARPVTRRAPRRDSRPPLVLIVAGSDPSGGAGLELDLKVLALHGVHGAAVRELPHAPERARRRRDRAAPVAQRRARIECVRAAARLGAVQIGMLADEAWIDGLARLVARGRWPPIRARPVLAPTRGPAALSRRRSGGCASDLLPRGRLLTPTAIEAAALLGIAPDEVRARARRGGGR
jgi:hypothetical protein